MNTSVAGLTESLSVLVLQLDSWSRDGKANFVASRDVVRSSALRKSVDLVVLPELVGADLDPKAYLRELRECALASGAWIVGGSHHYVGARSVVNRGMVVDRDGALSGVYEKRHPYGAERRAGVGPGRADAAVDVDGARVRVLLCADLWHSELLQRSAGADVVAVPAFSVTRSEPRRHARQLWRHMSIARAYEFGAYVAISDWAETSMYGGLPSSGAAGIASPAPSDGEPHFVATRNQRALARALDIRRLVALRADRRSRGFLQAAGE